MLDCNRIHSPWPSMESGDMDEIAEDGEDVNVHELEYTDGSNEVVKVLNEKCVICLERDSDFNFKQRGYQCICKECCQKKVILIY